jgi:glycosyltransferase involved in cell wall biosynthesis
MESYPKISIITPSYNQSQFIAVAIESVLTQNYENFEHIIIDGGSTDSTIEVLKKFPHLIWISELDEGQSDALNKGFKMAKGDIIGWLNSDDLYLPGTFNTVTDALNTENIDAVYSNCKFVDKDGTFLRNLNTHKPIKWLSLFQCYIPSTTFFFKKKIINADIYIDKSFHITMDKEFFAHILYSGFRIKYINDYFAEFRWHESNKSINSRKVQLMCANEGVIIVNRYLKLNISINYFTIRIYRLLALSIGTFRKIIKISSK